MLIDQPRIRRSFIMLSLCLAGGTIFILPFLREVYYIPMREAFGYSNTQMGILNGVFGAFSLATYFPGGWLADRISARRLMSTALIGCGLGGVYLSTLPTYGEALAIHAFWGICCSLIFWNAMIKATRIWASSQNQGFAFGVLESGRGITEMLISTLLLALFAWIGNSAESFSQIVLILAVANILVAVMIWITLEDDHSHTHSTYNVSSVADEIRLIIQLPQVWFLSFIVFCSYSAYWGTYYFAPYATEVFSISVVAGGTIGVARMWLKPASAFFAGLIADQLGPTRTVLIFLFLTGTSFSLLSVVPKNTDLFLFAMALIFVLSIAVSALRGIYFSMLEESNIPEISTGIAVGLISMIGFSPDVFMPILGGYLLDKFPEGLGYQYYFGAIAMICWVGVFMGVYVLRGRKSSEIQRS